MCIDVIASLLTVYIALAIHNGTRKRKQSEWVRERERAQEEYTKILDFLGKHLLMFLGALQDSPVPLSCSVPLAGYLYLTIVNGNFIE